MIVADSDVLIDALRGREPVASLIARELTSGQLATTAIAVFELLSGARSRQQRTAVHDLLEAMRILSLDEDNARHAADIRRELQGAGQPIGTADYLIAGICRRHSATLLTRNRSHFERVNGLHLGSLDA